MLACNLQSLQTTTSVKAFSGDDDMSKVKNMIYLMLLPPAITAACLVWVAYLPNPM